MLGPATLGVLLAGATFGVRLEAERGAPPEETRRILADLTRAIERQSGLEPVEDDRAKPCAPPCVEAVRSRTRSDDVVLVEIVGGLLKVRVTARRHRAGKSLPVEASADLSRSEAARWPGELDRLARALFPPPAIEPPLTARAETREESTIAAVLRPTLLGAGVVLLAVGIGFGASSRADVRALREGEGPLAPDEVHRLERRATENALIADGLFAGAAAAAIGAMLWWGLE